MNNKKKEIAAKLRNAGIRVTDSGKISKNDLAQARVVLAVESDGAFLKKVSTYRNKLIEILEEGKTLAKSGKNLKGHFSSCDFDGDLYEEHDNLGDAFGQTNNLDELISALYFFLQSDGKPGMDDAD